MPARLDIVCCSLEAWDEVWRRNQFLVDGILRQAPDARVLFVEPPADMAWELIRRRAVPAQGLRRVGDTGRLWAYTPRKWLPRRIAPGVDRRLGRRVAAVARRLGFDHPVAWINDSSYAALAGGSPRSGAPTGAGWPVVYDVTDDWLETDVPEREMRRQRDHDATLVARAAQVVVCSPALVGSRGRTREVHLIPNGIDVAHFRRPRTRPDDLPASPVALYVGTLASGRLDVELCASVAHRLAGRATLVFVGPNSLTPEEVATVTGAGGVILGARPYADVPAYMQHADVIVVPHVVTAFTESLDPIKAREITAVGRPAVTTPVAGLRDLGPPVTVAPAGAFAAAVEAVLAAGPVPPGPQPGGPEPPSWDQRATEFLTVLRAASDGTAGG